MWIVFYIATEQIKKKIWIWKKGGKNTLITVQVMSSNEIVRVDFET